MAAAVVAAVGAALPWASAFGASVYGVEGDGRITLGAAVVCLAVAWWRGGRDGRLRHVLYGLLGVLVLVVGVVDWTRFAAVGLFLTVAGGAVIIAAAAHSLARPTRAEADAAP